MTGSSCFFLCCLLMPEQGVVGKVLMSETEDADGLTSERASSTETEGAPSSAQLLLSPTDAKRSPTSSKLSSLHERKCAASAEAAAGSESQPSGYVRRKRSSREKCGAVEELVQSTVTALAPPRQPMSSPTMRPTASMAPTKKFTLS